MSSRIHTKMGMLFLYSSMHGGTILKQKILAQRIGLGQATLAEYVGHGREMERLIIPTHVQGAIIRAFRDDRVPHLAHNCFDLDLPEFERSLFQLPDAAPRIQLFWTAFTRCLPEGDQLVRLARANKPMQPFHLKLAPQPYLGEAFLINERVRLQLRTPADLEGRCRAVIVHQSSQRSACLYSEVVDLRVGAPTAISIPGGSEDSYYVQGPAGGQQIYVIFRPEPAAPEGLVPPMVQAGLEGALLHQALDEFAAGLAADEDESWRGHVLNYEVVHA